MQLAPAPWSLSLLLSLPLGAQEGGAHNLEDVSAVVEARRAAGAATAIRLWVAAFEKGNLDPTQQVRGGGSSDYLSAALDARLLFRAGLNRSNLTHIAMLQRLIGLAELHQNADCARALLWLSACGEQQDLYGSRVHMIRELGRFALMRMRRPEVWNQVMQTVQQDSAELDDKQGFEWRGEAIQGPPGGQIRQAAIHLLGMQRKPVFRPRLEGCLQDPDSRVRLAAAEALTLLHHRGSLDALLAAMNKEHHEVVSQALIHCLEKILDKHVAKLPKKSWQAASRTALGMLGRNGWRNDLTIVNLLRYFPIKEAVPQLIQAMARSRLGKNKILKIVNKNASQRLHGEIHNCLRRITGAIIKPDAAAWLEFWEQEKDRLVVKPADSRVLDKNRTYVKSAGTFYGIPVTGTEVVFVLDTSGSMKHKIAKKTAKALRDSGTVGKYQRIATRLDVARFQTLNAVHGMDPHIRYHIVSFSSALRTWNRKPVKPNKRSHGTLTSILSRMKPKGGTNVYDALLYVLKANELRYGQEIKNKVDEVFLLTDGMPSSGRVTDTEEILRIVREANKYQKIRINTVYSGRADSAGAKFLRQLAEENHGVFVQS